MQIPVCGSREKNLSSGPAAASRLRRLGYEATNEKTANGKWTVWSRSYPFEEDDSYD